jgi:hypothetical protein
VQTGEYETNLDKVALAVESIKAAKQMTVSEEGIGEDLNITIFCWRGTLLVSVIQLKNTFQLDRQERVNRITQGCCLMRRGWGVDSFTMIAEGYCSLAPSDTKQENLYELFTQPGSPVKECIAITHIDEDSYLFVSVPYSLKVGRVVEFDNPLWYKGRDALRDIAYPATMKAALNLKPVDLDDEQIDKEAFFETLADGMMAFGFEVFYREDV